MRRELAGNLRQALVSEREQSLPPHFILFLSALFLLLSSHSGSRSLRRSPSLSLPRSHSLVSCLFFFPDRDTLVAKGKASELSAAVVFLPERTLHFGKHGSDKCYCVEMYGEVSARRSIDGYR